MVRLGAHVSISGGVHAAPARAAALKLASFQIFAKNQRQWAARPFSKDDLSAWHDALKEHGYDGRDVVAHASYLISPATTNPQTMPKSRAALADELRRAHELGILGVCFHPGSHMGRGVGEGQRLVLEAMRHALEAAEGPALLLVEGMAGQGGALATTPLEIGALVEPFEEDRVGVTLDTCHLFASGQDLRGDAYGETMERLDAAFGLGRVRAWHLNDSVFGLGERKDRHERVGDGKLGKEGFVPLLKDARFQDTPGALETDPLDDEMTGYQKDLRRLRSWSK